MMPCYVCLPSLDFLRLSDICFPETYLLVLLLYPPHTPALGASYYHLVVCLIRALSFLGISPIEI